MTRRVLITGGAGFIGRWLVKACLDAGEHVVAIDNFFNSTPDNIAEFKGRDGFSFQELDIRDAKAVAGLFKTGFDVCYHLAASIVVQDSIDDPKTTIDNDILGTFHVLEGCRATKTKMIFMSTCMVYARAGASGRIAEDHATLPASPYAAAKLAGEALTLSYYHAYGLPTVVMRPFNTYGPFQRSDGEGGVVAVFLKRDLAGQTLNIYGDGKQTRDFLYVKDCAEFIRRVAVADSLHGQVINAGTGSDVTVNELAALCCKDAGRIKHVTHIHPQSEIMKLCCDAARAKRELTWSPTYDLAAGLRETRDWLASQREKNA